MRVLFRYFSQTIKPISNPATEFPVSEIEVQSTPAYLPPNSDDRIAKLGVYLQKETQFTKSPQIVWIFSQFLKRSPLTAPELLEIYQKDSAAKEQGLFRSSLKRSQSSKERLPEKNAQRP